MAEPECGVRFEVAGELTVFAFGLQEIRAVKVCERLAAFDFGTHVVDVEFVHPAVDVGRDDAMAPSIIVDHAGDLQGADERLDFRFLNLHMEDLNLALGEYHRAAAIGGVEAFFTCIDGGKFHAADRAAAGLFALDPWVHGTLIESWFALGRDACRVRRSKAIFDKPSGKNSQCRSDEYGKKSFHDKSISEWVEQAG